MKKTSGSNKNTGDNDFGGGKNILRLKLNEIFLIFSNNGQ
jgi:hypothetical protein